MAKRSLRTSKWLRALAFEIGVPGEEHSWMSAQQVEQVYHDKLYGIVEASTKSGKTRTHLHWLVSEALQAPFPDTTICWWVAPTYDQAKIAFANLLSDFRPLVSEINRSAPATVTLTNGAKIQFKSGDNPHTLYGFEIWACVVDEASRLDEGSNAGRGLQVFTTLNSTMTFTRGLGGGRMRIIGNVVGRNSWMFRQARAAEAGMKNWFYGTRNVDDSIRDGFIDPEEIETIRESMVAAGAEPQFMQDYYNVPWDSFLNPFGDDALDDCVFEASDFPEFGIWSQGADPMAFGLDIARKRDWTVCIGLDADMRVTKFYRSQAEWEDQKFELRDFTGGLPVLMDATGVGDVFLPDLQMVGVDAQPYIFTYDSRNQLVRRIIHGLRDRNLKIPEGVIMRELRNLETQETPGGRISYGVPNLQHDDCLFSLGLATEQWHRLHEIPWGIVTASEVDRVRQRLAAQRKAEEAISGVA